MGDYYDNETADGPGTRGFWNDLLPGVRSAVVFWLFLVGVAVIYSFHYDDT